LFLYEINKILLLSLRSPWVALMFFKWRNISVNANMKLDIEKPNHSAFTQT